jgi:crotonobetainyl-CoA:carnitine CoA-transferase CaiB-like acyl-CoA transferase
VSGPLAGVRIVSVAINLPGPAAAARLTALGADVTAVLPPSGDPLQRFARAYFDELHLGQEVVDLDLKDAGDAARLDHLLAGSDVLLTSSRPSALRRLGLDHENVSSRHTQLCQVDIVGHPGEGAEVAGHDLTYQASTGLVPDGRMPVTTVVDLAAAERAAGEAAASLLERARTGRGCRREVALSDVAETLVRPVVHGLTGALGLLGGGLPVYAVYAAAEGHVALAALEPHFTERLLRALDVGPGDLTREHLERVFAGRSAAQWEHWARGHDIPLVAVTDRQG